MTCISYNFDDPQSIAQYQAETEDLMLIDYLDVEVYGPDFFVTELWSDGNVRGHRSTYNPMEIINAKPFSFDDLTPEEIEEYENLPF